MAMRLAIKVQFTLLLLSLLCASVIFATTTGKIAGQVVDAETGEPMPGVNIIIEGAEMGAATDLEGYYTILQVPSGSYTVRASAIGFAKIVMPDVRVRMDQTARADFSLKMESVEGEEITVVADKDVIKEEVATSVVTIEARDVSELPVTTVQEVVELQAGVDENLTIRGGASDGALFQVNGVTMRDPRNNKPIMGVPLSAIQEVSMERGGFKAEYGQVRSGVINVLTREGDKSEYSGSVTLRYSPPVNKHFGISPFDANSMWNRPYLDDAVAWTGTQNGGWDEYEARQYPKFDGWNKISEQLLTDADPENDLSPAGAQRVWQWQRRRQAPTDQPDYVADVGFGGPAPFISESLGNLRFYTAYRKNREMLLIPLSRDDYVEDAYSLNLTSDITKSIKLRFNGYWGRNKNVAINATDGQYYQQSIDVPSLYYWNPTDYMRTPLEIAALTAEQRPGRIFSNSWYSPAEVRNQSYSLKMTHILSSSTYYEAGAEITGQKYETGPIAERDYTKNYEILPGYYVDEAPFGFSPLPQTGLDGMFFGGHTSTTRDSSKSLSTRVHFDLTSQVNFQNQVKAGAEFIYTNLDLNYGEINNFTNTKNLTVRQDQPIRLAAYVQDRFETRGLSITAGLRMDYINSNADWFVVDAFDKSFFSAKYDPAAVFSTQSAKAKVYLSPRLAISHPITSNSKLYFNYGHYQQLPAYEQIFSMARGGSSQMTNLGNPELLQANTIAYELGYDHALWENLLVQFSAYYRDISDQQSFVTYSDEVSGINYNQAANNNYEDVRGFEATLRKSRGMWWSGFVNYTYQVNTMGHFGQTYIFASPSDQKAWDRQTQNLYQERPIPRPYARASMTFYTPAMWGPSILGEHILGNWYMNFLADWKSGRWYTWNPNGMPQIALNVHAQNTHNVALRINKTFRFSKWEMSLFCEINNLFNDKFLSMVGFYDVNDQIDYFESLHLPESDVYNNIAGSDRVGDYRLPGVNFQPIEQIGQLETITDPNPAVIYYNIPDGAYMEYVENDWRRVDSARMKKVLDDKAYIDMPNQTSFNFLNPRQFFFGIRTSFNLN